MPDTGIRGVADLAGPDVKAAATIHAFSFPHGWSEAEFRNYANSASHLSLGNWYDGELTAILIAGFAADEAEILTISTHPQWRRQGIAGHMLESAAARLAAKDICALFLEVAESNLPAIALYKQHGFAQVGKRRGYYHNSDRREDALIMRKNIGFSMPHKSQLFKTINPGT